MSNIKFSDFTAEGTLSNFTGLVGFDANNNYKISPAQLVTALEDSLYSTSALPVSKGGTGNTSFGTGFLKASGTQNLAVQASINLASDVGTSILPADHGGTGVAGAATQKVWSAVQQFIWEDGDPTGYIGIPNATDIYLPFKTTATIDESTNTAANTKWTITNSAQPSGTGPSLQSTFTLGTDGGGIWRIDVIYDSFNLVNFVQARLSLDIDQTIIPVYGKDYVGGNGGTPQSLAGNLTYEFSGGEEVRVQIRIDGSSGAPYPGDTAPWTNRPPEITFTRIV